MKVIGSSITERVTTRYDLRVSDGTNRFIANSNLGIGLADAQWHHVAVVFDREAGTDTAYFYLDGSPVGSESSALIAGNSASDTDDLGIGASAEGGTLHPWKGNIDDPRIYDRVLSAAEITALAASPPAPCTFVYRSGGHHGYKPQYHPSDRGDLRHHRHVLRSHAGQRGCGRCTDLQHGSRSACL